MLVVRELWQAESDVAVAFALLCGLLLTLMVTVYDRYRPASTRA